MNAEQHALRWKTNGATVKQSQAEALMGDFAALLRRLGLPDAATQPDLSAPSNDPAAGATALRNFLETYRAAILIPLELPAIVRACGHAARGHWRDLVALDAELGAEALLRPFAEGSRQVGRWQLERLRPLRDRATTRYLEAVETDRAQGWHTVAYGIFLAVYSCPLRQGLLHYARETMAGLAGTAPAIAQNDLPRDFLEILQLPAAVERVLAAEGGHINSIASP